MRDFELIFYVKVDGTVPAKEFIDSLPEKMRAKIVGEMDILKEYGNELREPYTKYIGDGLFELRAKVGSDISRVIYFFCLGRQIIFTNGFVKKTWKIPVREINKAKKYREDYLERMEGREA